ncbi:hypothetical protein OJAV_G00167280 [Oryzias javanicus]|uniref:Uncharacterized protein n=1 Tax=Oryzias javanicus TaxID=123683 RepID=A0A3S2NWQ9_ORYJA|nr:hypothetical protein OJAV_G00167280 [Oryzias javanicus]
MSEQTELQFSSSWVKAGRRFVGADPQSSSMDQREDTQEGAPPSKKWRGGNHDNQSKAQRGQQVTQRVQSAAFSCGSMKSDRSKDQPPFFRTEPEPSDSHVHREKKRSGPQSGESEPDHLLMDSSGKTSLMKELLRFLLFQRCWPAGDVWRTSDQSEEQK